MNKQAQNPLSLFSNLDLKPALLQNLDSLGYTSMTPIQQQSLPHVLAGKDVIGQGKTGSGKTAAFGLGLLNKLDVKHFRVQALVLCPTRELADQVAKEIRRLARAIHNIKVLTLCGGMPFGPQKGSLEHGAHIIVGTPGRVEDHIRKGNLDLGTLTTLILDEADRMLDMGFQESLDNIISQAPDKKQTLLFSATFPKEIEAIASRIMLSPTIIQVESTHESSSINQHFYTINQHDRITSLRILLHYHQPRSAVIFCNTKKETQTVADILQDHDISALAIHGDLEQKERDQVLVRFANGSATILVATDVAARGLDIENLDAVFNYQMTRDIEVHVHRVGRTGRAGSNGIACTLLEERELFKLEQLTDYTNQKWDITELPHESILAADLSPPEMATLQIDGGKKQKVRPGDILGALTAKKSITANDVGKINIYDFCAYVAVKQVKLKEALKLLTQGKLKGRSFRVRHIR